MEYCMTEPQFEMIMDACKPTPVMFLSGGRPMFNSPEENANHAWKVLGDELGFDYMTVAPMQGKDSHWFKAEIKPVRNIIKEFPKIKSDETTYRIYADGFIYHQDDFEEKDNSLPYYDDYETITIPDILVNHIIGDS